jgi:hypothetical protein
MNGKITLLTVSMILGLTANGLAQGAQTGTIRGTVTDAQNAVMPGVTVTATSPSLQGSRSVLTDGQGGFSLRNLPAGTTTSGSSSVASRLSSRNPHCRWASRSTKTSR